MNSKSESAWQSTAVIDAESFPPALRSTIERATAASEELIFLPVHDGKRQVPALLRSPMRVSVVDIEL